MSNEALQPRSKILREALDRAKDTGPAQIMLTVAEACAHLRISKWSLYRLIQKKELKTVKIGKRRLIRLQTILEFVRRREAEGGD